MGPIPSGYRAEQNVLLIGDRRVDTLVAEAGDTPLFVYDLDRVAAQARRFRATFPGVSLHYAIKANTYQPLLDFVSRQVDGLDVASAAK